MSSTSENIGPGKDYNLSQIVALGVTYRHIMNATLRFPALVIATPLVLKVVCFLADGLTKNHSVLTLILTILLTAYARQVGRMSAPSAKVAEETLARFRLRIPSSIFVLIALIMRYGIARIEEPLGLTKALTWSPSFSFGLAIRLAIGMFLLSIAVIVQYVGPASVVRCSSSPLLENPISEWIKTAAFHLRHSPAAFADSISRPREGSVSSTRWSNAAHARRLQRPTLRATVQQFLAAIVIGPLVAVTTAVPVFSSSFPSGSSNTVVASCIFATVINLLVCLDGASHEISPYRHRFGARSSRGIFGALAFSNPSFLISSIVVPILALLSSSIGSQEPNTDSLTSFMVSLITTWVVIIYLNVFDEELRTALCTPPFNMKRAVDEVLKEDGMQTYLDVTMCSILHSDVSLVEQLSSIGKVRLLSLDREERGQNEDAMKSMANILLQKTAADENGAHLEEDILRLAILSSLGGLGSGAPIFDSAGLHHLENIKQWVLPRSTQQVAGGRSDILSVPLVRALCAYGGGLGEALIMCSAQRTNSPIFAWSVPPGALVQSEYAIRAAARCIVLNLANSAQCRTDWRSSHLSMMIPVLMNSACRLQTGVVRYAERKRTSKQGSTPNKKMQSTALTIPLETPFHPDEDRSLLRTESPELLRVYNACNRSAAMVLEQLHSLEGTRGFELGLEGLTRKWMNHVIASMPNQSSNVVMPSTFSPMK